MPHGMDEKTYRRILDDITEAERDAEDLPEVSPLEFDLIAFRAPDEEQRPSHRCITCWARTNFAFRYESGHPQNRICFHCLDVLVPEARRHRPGGRW